MKKLASALFIALIVAVTISHSHFVLPVKLMDAANYGRYLPSAISSLYQTFLWPISQIPALFGPSQDISKHLQPSLFVSNDKIAEARIHWYRGDFLKARKAAEEHIKVHGESEYSLYWLAFSEARLGEEINCLAHLTQPGKHLHHMMPMSGLHKDYNTMCSLPLVMTHTQKGHSERAVQIFSKMAKNYPGNSKLYRYLANFYSLTLGKEFKEAPKEISINSPFTEFYSISNHLHLKEKYSWLKLPNKAAQLGIDVVNAGKGIAVEDFNDDGHMDLIVIDIYQPIKYFQGTGNGYVEVKKSGLETSLYPFLATAADINNDGYMDLYITRASMSDQVFINDGQGHFSDQSRKWGIQTGLQNRSPWIPSFADFDNDGDLDLFISKAAIRTDSTDFGSSMLLRNNTDHFEDVTESLNLSKYLKTALIMGSSWGDFNNDGFQDLIVGSPNFGASMLLKNNGGKSFEKYDKDFGPAFPVAMLDVDHDGDLDIFIPGSVFSVKLAVDSTVFGIDTKTGQLGRSRFFINESGKFNDPIYLDHGPQSVMGSNYGDINNDGCWDFYLGTGTPEEAYVLPNLFFLGKNDGHGGCKLEWANITPLEGLGSIQKGHGIAFYDFDHDGDQDIYSNLGGAWPGDVWPNQMFVNESETSASWLQVRLRGVKSNRFAIGAMIRVNARTDTGKTITRYHHIDNKTGFGSAPYLAYIGLASATKILSVEVLWPSQKSWQKYEAKINSFVELEEK